MKIKSLCLLIVTIIFTSCTRVDSSVPSTATAFPTSIPIIASTSSPEFPTASPIMVEGFAEPDPKTWVAIMPAVQEYFYYRQKAIISNNIEELWAHYPELKNGVDVYNGVNREETLIGSFHSLEPFDGNFFPEQYERIRVKIISDKAEVYVHGIELLLFVDENGNFQNSGGEIKIVLYMQKHNNRWVVYKTDEIQMDEQNPFAP